MQVDGGSDRRMDLRGRPSDPRTPGV